MALDADVEMVDDGVVAQDRSKDIDSDVVRVKGMEEDEETFIQSYDVEDDK